MKIVDVSNSSLANPRNLGGNHTGPRENDIVRYLKQYAHEFGHEFVPYMLGGEAGGIKPADVVFTNDVWPETEFWKGDDPFPGKFKVKRMDGVFSRADVVHRNKALNEAARQADHVIFISDYSKESYFRLYDENRETIKSYSVIPNAADPAIFYPGLDWTVSEYNTFPQEVIAIASDWTRPEKRLVELLMLADMEPDIDFVIAGALNPNIKLPRNIRLKGYLDTPEKIADSLRMSDAMISLFYKDPHPKTVIQGMCCGLPMLYTASGGQSRMGITGVAVPDTTGRNWFSFDDEVPRLNTRDIEEAWLDFKVSYHKLKPAAMQYRGRKAFTSMLRGYFQVMQG